MTRIQYGSKAFILSDEHMTTAFIALPMGGYTYHQFFNLDMAKEYVKVQLTSPDWTKHGFGRVLDN